MLPVTGQWAPAIEASRRVAHRVEVWRGGQLLIEDLPVSGGSVLRDHGAVITMSADIDVADPSYLPVDQSSPLMPLGSELRIHTGIRYAGGGVELLHIFSGPIVAAPTVAGTGGFRVRAEGWLRYVADDDFLAPYAPSGPSTIAAVRALLAESLPAAPVHVSPALTDRPVPEGMLYDADRMQAVQDLAAGIGATVRETPGGGIAVAADPPPDPAAAPVRSYIHGDGNTLLARSEPELTRDERYNAVLMRKPGDDAVRAVARIEDPDSPVRWGGPFGRKVLLVQSETLTAATVQAATDARLASLRGRIRKITADVAPDPSLEPGDHVLIRWPRTHRSAAQIKEVAQVRSVRHPIGPGRTRLELRGTA